jgi:hypothetical protein
MEWWYFLGGVAIFGAVATGVGFAEEFVDEPTCGSYDDD